MNEYVKTIIVDTREKWTQANSTDTHIKDYFERHGIAYKVQKLPEGDYMLEGQTNITIDRKCSMTEMYHCLVGDRARFYKEVRRCNKKGIKLVLLIEQSKIKSIDDVGRLWQPKYGTLSSRDVMERLYRLHISYGVEIVFCDRRSTGRKIVDILTAKTQNND